jgi:hypothetical protein
MSTLATVTSSGGSGYGIGLVETKVPKPRKKWVCPNCNTPNSGSRRYCNICGCDKQTGVVPATVPDARSKKEKKVWWIGPLSFLIGVPLGILLGVFVNIAVGIIAGGFIPIIISSILEKKFIKKK